MKTIAFVTCSSKPDIATDDQHLSACLNKKGMEVTAVPWDNPDANWSRFECVILRSTWNYHLHPEKFSKWLSQMEAANINLLNPSKIVRWNMHKRYLHDLALEGVAIPETEWITRGSKKKLREIMEQRKWNRAVIKPAISATAHKTILVGLQDADDYQLEFLALIADHDVLVQQFIPEVQTEGEWSLLFFNKKFSHGVLKRPRQNDFRVQNDFGGTALLKKPPEEVIRQAYEIIGRVKSPLLYTRVDGVVSNNRFLLMELELIEPVLFFGEHQEAASHFVDVLFEMK